MKKNIIPKKIKTKISYTIIFLWFLFFGLSMSISIILIITEITKIITGEGIPAKIESIIMNFIFLPWMILNILFIILSVIWGDEIDDFEIKPKILKHKFETNELFRKKIIENLKNNGYTYEKHAHNNNKENIIFFSKFGKQYRKRGAKKILSTIAIFEEKDAKKEDINTVLQKYDDYLLEMDISQEVYCYLAIIIVCNKPNNFLKKQCKKHLIFNETSEIILSTFDLYGKKIYIPRICRFLFKELNMIVKKIVRDKH